MPEGGRLSFENCARRPAAPQAVPKERSRAVKVVVALACIGGLLYGLDQGGFRSAVEKQKFILRFCNQVYDCLLYPPPAPFAQFLRWGGGLQQLGAAFTSLLIAPVLAARLGRREALLIGAVALIIGLVPLALIKGRSLWLTDRFAAGAALGVVNYALPMFLSEVAPAELRGRFGAEMAVAISLGYVIAALVNINDSVPYQVCFLLPCAPALVVACGALRWLPPSPRFAIVKFERLGNPDEGVERARTALRRLRESDELVEAELEELKVALSCKNRQAPWSALWRERTIFRRVAICFGLNLATQLSGFEAAMNHGPRLVTRAIVGTDDAITLDKRAVNLEVIAVFNAVFQLIGTVCMMWTIDKWGRKALLIAGACGMAASMVLAGVFALAIQHTLELEGVDDTAPVLGWLLLLSICLYLMALNFSWGPMTWIYASEIFPMDVKERAFALCSCFFWLAQMLALFLFAELTNELTAASTFFVGACASACGVIFAYSCVVETSGVRLEDMDSLFGDREALLRVDSDGNSSNEIRPPMSLAGRTSARSLANGLDEPIRSYGVEGPAMGGGWGGGANMSWGAASPPSWRTAGGGGGAPAANAPAMGGGWGAAGSSPSPRPSGRSWTEQQDKPVVPRKSWRTDQSRSRASTSGADPADRPVSVM